MPPTDVTVTASAMTATGLPGLESTVVSTVVPAPTSDTIAASTGDAPADTPAEQIQPVIAGVQPDRGWATAPDDRPAATGLADRILAEDSLGILRLVEEDDSWPLVVVPVDRVDPILRLAERLGQRVERTA